MHGSSSGEAENGAGPAGSEGPVEPTVVVSPPRIVLTVMHVEDKENGDSVLSTAIEYPPELTTDQVAYILTRAAVTLNLNIAREAVEDGI
jgi:hypothetical protein